MRVPGRRTPDGGRDWSFGRAYWDVESHPAALRAWCVTESALRPGLPLWVVENGMATRVRRRARRPAGGRHGPAPLRARAPGRGGRRRGGGRPVTRLLPLVAGRQLRVGHLRAPLRPLRRGPQRPRGRALHGHRRPGDDAAGEFARVRGRPAGRGPLGAGPAGLSRQLGGGSPPGVGGAPPAPRSPPCSLRRWRTTSTTITTRMRPSTTSDAMPVAFSTRWPTK